MDDEPLVRAMPRGPLYPLRGLITRIDLTVLTAIDEEGWFATRSAIAADVEGKEVRLAVVVTCGDEALVGADGRLAHVANIGPECEGLGALKQLAKATAEQASGGIAHGVELAGYLNDDAEPALRHVFVLAYRARVPAGTAAPAGMSWLGKAQLPAAADPFSAKLAALLP
jgi:hypothetical protein